MRYEKGKVVKVGEKETGEYLANDIGGDVRYHR